MNRSFASIPQIRKVIMKKKFITLSVVAVGAMVFTACGGDDSTDSSSTEAPAVDVSNDDASESIDVSGVWARTSPAMTSLGAVYMNITATADDELLAASVDASIAGSAEVHETVSAQASDDSMPMGDMSDDSMPMDGMSGEMMMREVSSIGLSAGETVQLMPGGYHIMLLDLVAPLELGQTFEVTLTFANAGTVKVMAEVRDEAP